MSDDLCVRTTITVNAPQETAFGVFCEELTSWWPLDACTIGDRPAVAAVLQRHTGGRWYEQAADGTIVQFDQPLPLAALFRAQAVVHLPAHLEQLRRLLR